MRKIRGKVRRDKTGAADRLGDKRYVKRVRRDAVKIARRRGLSRQSKAIYNAFLEYGSNTRKTLDRLKKKKEIKLKLEEFSFLTNPDETLRKLCLVAALEDNEKPYTLDFEDERCIDIGPFMVIGLLFSQANPVWCQGGKMNSPVMKVLASVGVRDIAGMSFPTSGASDVWPFRLATHTAVTQKVSGFESFESANEKVGRRFADSVNGWLNEVGFGLTRQGGDWLRNLLTETLDNARHASVTQFEGQWSVAGFMARRRRPDGSSQFICHIGIVTTGKTIFETLQSSDDPKVLEDVSNYCVRHKDSSKKWTAQSLANVASLADGISCEGTSADQDIGGCGMSSLVNMMNELGENSRQSEQPTMTIISGSGCLLLTYPYNKMQTNEDSIHYQAFNSEQELDSAPDDSFVFDLEEHFPGTIVSMRFCLEKDALTSRYGQ